jgi:hypothetical protein
MVDRSLDAPGTTAFTFARSCATDMRITIQVADQDGRGTKAVSNTLSVPQATGCPAAPFDVAGSVRALGPANDARLNLELDGTVSPSGGYFYQWHGTGTDRAIEAYLPDPELAWYGPQATPIIPCGVLADGHTIVLIAYSQADTRIAARSAPVTLPACPNTEPATSPPPTPGDLTPPTIVSRSPGSGSTGIDRDRTLRIRVSERVQGVSATTVRLQNLSTGRTVRVRVLRYDVGTRTIILDPYYRMAAGTRYRLSIRIGIKDLSANRLVTQSWTFRTGRS